ncbi:MAG: hypothetical protein GX454_14660 [Brooklawnia sp.]|nr:hypothetical protein [Brooklawnia sp.]
MTDIERIAIVGADTSADAAVVVGPQTSILSILNSLDSENRHAAQA